MRDRRTHRYFHTLHEIVADGIEQDLPSLTIAFTIQRKTDS